MKLNALEGIKVLDFGWAIAGSLTGKYLGDYGATVVKVESSKRPDLMRTSRQGARSKTDLDDRPGFVNLNTSKYGITLDLQHPRAREVIEKLVLWADVINENFTPGTMAKLGWSYENVRAIKPEIIMVSGSLYGQTGPLSKEWGVDGSGAAASGFYWLGGWPDREPSATRLNYGDTMLPLLNVSAVVAALDYKNRTGKGQYIDVSMLEVWSHMITPAILDWESNNHLQTRNGNRVSNAAPHGVFPCKGDDRWCAITVFTDEEWRAFCKVIGNPAWTQESRFSTLDLRKENENQLEELVASWTKNYTAEEVMDLLQASGVPSGVVEDDKDLLENDPQLRERKFLVSLQHPVLGNIHHPTPPFKLLNNPPSVRTAPCLGEHTEYVCTRLIGMSDDEFMSLFKEGVFD